MREIDKYIVMNIYLEFNNGTLHIKPNYRRHKSNKYVVVVTHVKKLL
jgi:hypothetical protein